MAGTLAATITAVAPQSATAAFAGAGTLDTAAMTPKFAMATALGAAGSLTATDTARYARSAALDATGTITATSSQKYAPTPALAGTGVLSATMVGIFPITVIGTPAAVITTTIALPTHAVGDIIIIGAARTATGGVLKPTAGGTVPTWIDIDAPASANGASARTVYCVATATNHTSGTWGTSDGLCAIVLRGQKTSGPFGGHAFTSGTTNTSPNTPAITMTQTDGSSFLLHIYMHSVNGGWGTVPTGYTQQVANSGTSTAFGICINSKNVTTSDGAVVQPDTTIGAVGSAYFGTTIEILRQ
jgi:hypothetical protein